MKKQILGKYKEEGKPPLASSRMWDDGVIDPRVRGMFFC